MTGLHFVKGLGLYILPSGTFETTMTRICVGG